MRNLLQILIALDQLLNTLLVFLPGQTWADETLSARAWRCRDEGAFKYIQPVIDRLFFWQHNHCEMAYIEELKRYQAPPETRE